MPCRVFRAAFVFVWGVVMVKRNEISTHIRVVDDAVKDGGSGFELSVIKPRSANFSVRTVPVALVAWGLAEGETVAVRRAKVASLGVSRWRDDGSCCGGSLSPDDNGNIEHMPYKRCGADVVLTAQNPHAVVDDVGTFFLEYSGGGDVVIDKMDDPVVRKVCG